MSFLYKSHQKNSMNIIRIKIVFLTLQHGRNRQFENRLAILTSISSSTNNLENVILAISIIRHYLVRIQLFLELLHFGFCDPNCRLFELAVQIDFVDQADWVVQKREDLLFCVVVGLGELFF